MTAQERAGFRDRVERRMGVESQESDPSVLEASLDDGQVGPSVMGHIPMPGPPP